MYGLQPDVIWDGMPLAMVTAYIANMPQIIAERRVEAATAAGFPFVEDPGETMNQWLSEALQEAIEPEIATPGMLKLMGMGVEHVG